MYAVKTYSTSKKVLTLAVKVKIEEWIVWSVWLGAGLEGMECGLDSSLADRHQLKITEQVVFPMYILHSLNNR